MVQYESIKVTFQRIEYIPRQATPSVSFQSKRRATFRRTPKGRRQAESRHSCKAYFLTAPRSPIECEAALFAATHLPTHQKLPCTATAVLKTQKIFTTQSGGCHAGKFGESQGGLEGRESPFQGDSLRLQGLPHPLTTRTDSGRC